MSASKYSNFLTILLVVAIIAIIVLLGFFGYDVYNKYSINKGAEDAISRFEDAINEESSSGEEASSENTEQSSQSQESVESPIDNVSQSSTTNTNNSGGTTTYKGYTMVGTIKIPAIGIEYPILEKVTKKSIQVAVAILYGPGLNKEGNTVIVGHNYRNGTFFSNLSKLKAGDKIYITDTSGTQVTYTVYNNYETTDEDTKYMTRDTQGKKEISLSTCTTDSNYRTIILASAE